MAVGELIDGNLICGRLRHLVQWSPSKSSTINRVCTIIYSPSTSLVFIDNEKKIDYHLILLMLSVTETM